MTTPSNTDRPSFLRAVRALLRTGPGQVFAEFITLFVVAGYFLLYGLAPLTGGAQLGLVGADEPRYAQIAREMLERHNANCQAQNAGLVPHGPALHDLRASYSCIVGGTVTPVLYGRPWLEKPALYYWRAMGFFKEFGVSDWSARLPSTSGAALLILLAFLHLRRFRPGGHLDAALIMISTASVAAFARGASTDMQLAAPFCLGMLGWYAWYETGKKFWLFDLYFFGAAATLAKGPVAPFLCLAIITLFLALRRELSALKRTIWIPGILLYLVMVLPWFIAVQLKNPAFFREFFLEHNIARYTSNLYQHHQPFYYYLIVLILGLMPWTALAARALVDGLLTSIAEWKVRFKPARYLGHVRPGDAFPEFLVLWALFPVIFFSFSGSKLPGYILPSIPPLAILTGDWLYRVRKSGLHPALLNTHAAFTGIITFVILLCPQYIIYQRIIPSAWNLTEAAFFGILASFAVIYVTNHYGVAHTRTITLIPLALLLWFLLGPNGRLLDLNYSARPLAEQIQAAAPGVSTVAQLDVRRDMVYGIAFYRNHEVPSYRDGIPQDEHVLVLPTRELDKLPDLIPGRTVQSLFLYPTQGLSVVRVLASASAQ